MEENVHIISREDFQDAEERYIKEVSLGEVKPNTQFHYGYCLIYSQNKSDITKGLRLLQDLCHSGTDQRDYLYYLAEGNYRLSEYNTALKYTHRILQIEPTNRQALDLDEKIRKKMQKDGLIGLGIVGTAVVVGGAAAILGFVASRFKK
ncbi:mitochondrial fission 1 protein [Exaiptasia diaphana]|uniref:Mitochondrial fission 1 protein n=1 Tax=Exaiptasia diaphana TaxID=2652724 RepID=A0A913XPL3_EXADI|nr:mitochondrial fission 1 protein [Exaiptasia diaphana]